MKYVKFPKNRQKEFLILIKNKTASSWKQISSLLKVNRSMVYFYLNEHSRLPHESYKKLCHLAKIKRKKNIRLIEIKNKEEKIKIPKLSVKLAEFLGALAGDGHTNKITYEVSISLDKDLDEKYSTHVVRLYQELFGIQARKYVQTKYNKVKCCVYSKKLVEFLSTNHNVPTGNKKGKLTIPKNISQNNRLLKAYIRGMFDTDGSFHRHHKNDAMLGIISRDYSFIQELKQALTKLNFTASLHGKNLYIYRKKEIERFFRELKPSNAKHLNKYAHYKKFKEVPLTKDILKR